MLRRTTLQVTNDHLVTSRPMQHSRMLLSRDTCDQHRSAMNLALHDVDLFSAGDRGSRSPVNRDDFRVLRRACQQRLSPTSMLPAHQKSVNEAYYRTGGVDLSELAGATSNYVRRKPSIPLHLSINQCLPMQSSGTKEVASSARPENNHLNLIRGSVSIRSSN